MLRRSPDLSWSQFTKELLIRFGDNTPTNYYEAWGSTRQTGSLEDYVSRFIVRAAQVPNLDDKHYLGQFLVGLRPDIRMKFREDTITDVYAAVKWAGQIERELSYDVGSA